MASIIKRTVDGKPRYDVKYREPDGRQRKKTFTKKVDAERFKSTVEADVLRGSYIDPDAGRITFRKYAEEWIANQTFDPTTKVAVEQRLSSHVYPVLGGKMIGSIKPSTIQSWLSGLKGAASSRRLLLTHVSTILSAAVADEILAKNPCNAPSISKPRKEIRKVVPWTVERVAAVRMALPEPWRIVLELGVGLGLRQGEIFGLSPDDVDFLRGEVTVRRQVKMLSGKLFFGLPKGGKVRTVPLPSTVRDLLAAYLTAKPARAVVLPWGDVDGDSTTVRLVVTTRNGAPASRTYFNQNVWKPALDAAKVPMTRENGCHALRHHYASVLLDAGESIKAVSEYLGHADPGFTLRTYTHLMPSSDLRTKKAVDDAFARYIGGASGVENAAL